MLDGVVTASDATVNGIVKACREDGIRMPEGFSLIGFGNITGELFYIKPTTVAVSHEEQMETAVELPLGTMEESTPVGGKASVKLKPRLVERHFCKGWTRGQAKGWQKRVCRQQKGAGSMQADTEAGTEGGAWEFSRRRRLMNQAGSIVVNPYNIMVVISVIFTVYLILILLGQMIIQVLTLVSADMARVNGGREGMFTLYYWRRVLTSSISRKILRTPLKNPLLISVCTAISGITLGSLLAQLMVRSDLPYKKSFFLAPIIPYMISSWCKSMAWLIISRNERTNGAQGLLGFLGIQTPGWSAYEPSAIAVVLITHYYAYAHLLMSSALGSINSELEETGETLGVSKARIFAKIILPLVMSATLLTVIMTFSKVMGTFGVPSVLGLEVGYYTVSVTMCNSIQDGQSRVVFVTSLILVAIASLSIFLSQKAIGSRKFSSTTGSKGGRNNPIRLGKWRPVTVGILTVFTAVAVVFPVVTLLYQSSVLELGNYSLSSFILHYWTGGLVPTTDQGESGISRNPQLMKYMVNTIKLVVSTPLFATVFGQLTGYINSRGRKLFLGELVEQPVFIPYLIPSIAFSVVYLVLLATTKKIEMMGYRIALVPSLYGTFAPSVLTAVMKNMSFASRIGTLNMPQISTELEETVQAENTGFPHRFFKIAPPLSKGGMINGFILVFTSIAKGLDLIVILIAPSQQTLPYMVHAYSVENPVQLFSAVAIVMFVSVLLVYWLVNAFADADVTKGS